MKFLNSNLYIILLLTVLIGSCKTDLLDLKPKGSLTEETTFTNYNNFITYAWQFYEVFPGYAESVPNQEFNGDLFLNANSNATSDWIWQRIVIPSSSDDYNDPFTKIRAINIMLDNIDQAKLSETEKNHIRSLGYFFKAYNYMSLLNRYGSITWVEHTLKDDDTETLYGPRTPRETVAQNILDLLEYAEKNIKPNGDGQNTVDVNVVRALISRFGLREGTWRKYHNLGDHEKYLRASIAASEKLISDFPTLHPDYDEIFNSESLAGKVGILLYKQYEQTQVTHSLASRARNSAGRWDLTKKAADLYLLTDGQPRWTSPLFVGDKDPYSEFRNRDKRLYFTVPPPFKVDVTHPSAEWKYTSDAKDREYIDIMDQLSVATRKTLPTLNWQGLVVKQEPHFVDYNQGQPFNVTFTGYRFYKFSNKINMIQNQDINDAPIFRMGEILVNHAEAKYEVGEFTQLVADATINKLRARGGVAPLIISSISIDPTRDPTVTPELWEIRRERAVELMGEGFRFDDLRRWKKMDYAIERKLGRWITKGVDVPANNPIPILDGANAGYISYEGQAPSSFPDYYYLYPIPSSQIVLNPEIEQNPEWK